MNADFHYHATHLAARIAGFNKAEADTIGYAAAFVDELSASAKPAKSPSRVTVMTTAELLKMPFSSPFTWSTADKRKFFEVWQCFHFLPGNEFYHKRYEGPRSHSAVQSWSYSGEDDEFFRYLCLPNSILAEEMITHTKKYASRSNYLHMLGLRMHVYADTWAHQYFIGFPLWFANEVDGNEVAIKVSGQWERPDWKEYSAAFTSDDLEKKRFVRTPAPTLYYNGIPYLGHGRIGSMQDYGCLEYIYKPHWMQNTEYLRVNADVFIEAFKKMVDALLTISGKGRDERCVCTDSDLKRIFATWKLDQSQEWNRLIKEKCGYELEQFKAKKWFDEFPSGENGNYMKFKEAADDHVAFIDRSILETARFWHTYKADDKAHGSSLINYIDWQKKKRAAVYMDGTFFIREESGNYPAGPLQRADHLEYMDTGNRKCKLSIDFSFKQFRRIIESGKEEDLPEIDYFTWDDSIGYTMQIGESESPYSV